MNRKTLQAVAPRILKFYNLLLIFQWKKVFVLVSELVNLNFTTVAPPGEILLVTPWKKSFRRP